MKARAKVHNSHMRSCGSVNAVVFFSVLRKTALPHYVPEVHR